MLNERGPGVHWASTGVDAVDRALSILDAFDEKVESLSLAELASRTGLYKSTILRLIQSLARFSYIVRGTDGRYRIGPGVWRVGVLFVRGLRIEERLMPLLTELVDRTGESVSFYIPVMDPPPPARVCLLRLDSPHEVRDQVRKGDRLSLDVGAGGLVIRAFLLPTYREDDKIRETHVCTTWGNRNPEVCGVAAPVFGADNQLVGSLSLSGPTSRHNRKWTISMKPVVLAMAERATRALGGQTDAHGAKHLAVGRHERREALHFDGLGPCPASALAK
jgi:DNA-binding IclR family transcriptional regulator